MHLIYFLLFNNILIIKTNKLFILFIFVILKELINLVCYLLGKHI